MKHDIQQKLLKEYKGLPVDEVDSRRIKKIIKNPVLRKFIKRPSSSNKQVERLIGEQA